MVGTRIKLLIEGRDESRPIMLTGYVLGSTPEDPSPDGGAVPPIGGMGGIVGAKKGSYVALGRPSITRGHRGTDGCNGLAFPCYSSRASLLRMLKGHLDLTGVISFTIQDLVTSCRSFG